MMSGMRINNASTVAVALSGGDEGSVEGRATVAARFMNRELYPNSKYGRIASNTVTTVEIGEGNLVGSKRSQTAGKRGVSNPPRVLSSQGVIGGEMRTLGTTAGILSRETNLSCANNLHQTMISSPKNQSQGIY